MCDSARQSRHLETVKECPYCGDNLLSRSLHGHVLLTSGKGHGERGEIPEDFDADTAKVVGKVPITTTVPNKVPDDERIRCKYCDEVFKGYHGLKTHIAMTGEDADHPTDATDVPIETIGVRVPVQVAESFQKRADSAPDRTAYKRRLKQLSGQSVNEVVPRTVLEDWLDSLREREQQSSAYVTAANELADLIDTHAYVSDDSTPVQTPL
jgi:hypothetical protein